MRYTIMRANVARRRASIVVRLASALAILLVVAGCGGSKLTRSVALDILVASGAAIVEPSDITAELELWQAVRIDRRYMMTGAGGFNPRRGDDIRRVFSRIGLLAYRPVQEGDVHSFYYSGSTDDQTLEAARAYAKEILPLGIPELTPKGTELAKGWQGRQMSGSHNETGLDTTVWVVPLTTEADIAITGLLQSNETSAQIEYTLKYVPNNIGQELLKENVAFQGRKRLETGLSRSASFALFDDGWRLVR
jgi:hypothetical protein